MAKTIKNITINVNDDTLKLILDKISYLENRISILEADNGMTMSALNKILNSDE